MIKYFGIWFPLFWGGAAAITCKWWIFIRKQYRGKDEYILTHERIHLDQQKGKSFFIWVLKYIFSKKFRLSVEMEAYTEEIIYRKKNSMMTDIAIRIYIDNVAKSLSGQAYAWAGDYYKIKSELMDRTGTK